MRGGSRHSHAINVRVAIDNNDLPGNVYVDLGFRLVRAAS